jgi:hypothetical protein
MSQPIGHICWAKLLRSRFANAEGYIPAYSKGPEPQFTSHECLARLLTLAPVNRERLYA